MIRLLSIRILVVISSSIIVLSCFHTTANAQTVVEQHSEMVAESAEVTQNSKWVSFLTAGESIYLNYRNAIGMESIMFSTGGQIDGRHFIGLETGYTRRQANSSYRYVMMFPFGLTYKCKFSDRKISPFTGISALIMSFPNAGVKTGLVRPSIGVNFKTKKTIEFQACAVYDFSVNLFPQNPEFMHAVGLSLGMSFLSDAKGDTFKGDYYKHSKTPRYSAF